MTSSYPVDMDIQIQNAVDIAWNPRAEPLLKGEALRFLESLRENAVAWPVCLDLFTRSPKASDIVRHVALEVLNQVIQARLTDTQTLCYVKDNLLAYIRRVYGGATQEAGGVDIVAIQNKLTQTFILLFTSLYANEWKDFFRDFQDLAKRRPGDQEAYHIPGVELYLRVLGAVHDEIGDVLLARTEPERKRCTELKDYVRERDAVGVALSWQEILSQWREEAPGDSKSCVAMCLDVLARWVSWIDISLIVNDGILPRLFHIVQAPDAQLRCSAISAFTEIVAKKMNSRDKIDMMVAINLKDVCAHAIASVALQNQKARSAEMTSMAEAVAKLVNMAASEAIRALDSLDFNASHTRERANELLGTFVGWTLGFLVDDDNDISAIVVPSLSDLVAYFRKSQKKSGALSPQYGNMLYQTLQNTIAKTKYNVVSALSDDEGLSDDVESEDFRKGLQSLQQAVATVDEALYIRLLGEVVERAFKGFAPQEQRADWQDINLALHEMFLFGEIATKCGGLYSKGQPTSPAARALTAMVEQMIRSGIGIFPNPPIQLQFMEICVRYPTFFEIHPEFIPAALESCVHLTHTEHVRIRQRSFYLFQRFVRQLRAHLGDVSETVLQAVSDLLQITVDLPSPELDDDGLSTWAGDHEADKAFNNQLYLFEAVGCISAISAVPIEKQAFLARTLAQPLLSHLQLYLGAATGGDERSVWQIHHAIMALGTLAKGFADGTPTTQSKSPQPPTLVGDEFATVADAVVVALESLRSAYLVRTAARFAFSRLIAVLGARILPQLPRWIGGLLSASASKHETTTFLRLLEQTIFQFRGQMSGILDALLAPLLQRIFAQLAEASGGTDDAIQLAELRREYLNLIMVAFQNDIAFVLLSSTNQSALEQFITSVELFAKDVSDLPTARMAFAVLNEMASRWGSGLQADDAGTGASGGAAAMTNGTSAPDGTGSGGSAKNNNSSSSNSNDNKSNNCGGGSTAGSGGSNGSASASASAPTAAAATAPAPAAAPAPAIAPPPGFDRFLSERLAGLCWAPLASPAFDARDAQARQVAGEIALLQKTIYLKTGGALVAFLRDVCFPGLQLAPAAAEEYLGALQTYDVKAFKQFFLQFIQRRK